MYDDLVKRLRRYVEIERSEHHGAELEAEAADAIEELSAHYCPHAIRNVHDRGDDSLCRVLGAEPPKEEA